MALAKAARMGGARDLRAHEGDRDPRTRRARQRRVDRARRHRLRVRRQLHRHVGPRAGRPERGRDPEPRRGALLPHHRADPGPRPRTCRSCAARTTPPTSASRPASSWSASSSRARSRGRPTGSRRTPSSRGCPEDWDHITPYLAADRAPGPDPRRGRVSSSTSTVPRASPRTTATSWARRPGSAGYFVAAGFNSVGFAGGGGAGRAVADWLVDGHAPMDLWEVDIRRFMPFQRNRRYLHGRTTETLGLLYDMHWPFRQYETSRGVRRSPLHDRLAARQRVLRRGRPAGSGRTGTRRPGSSRATSTATAARTGSPHSAEEHRAVREGVGLFDQTSFGKILVQGRDAAPALGRICTADVDVEPGRIVYTQWLNERGGRGSRRDRHPPRRRSVPGRHDRHVHDARPRLASSRDPGRRACHRDRRHLGRGRHQRHGPAVAGPARSRCPTPTSRTTASRSGRRARSTSACAIVRAARITYVGELGWELYIPTEFATHVYDEIVAAGDAFGLRHAGYHALDSLRIEKAYRHWGHDMSDEDTALEAGLGFTVAWDKPGGFVGREALLRQREAGLSRRLAVFTLDDPEPLMYHNEPIWRDGELVGRITSGAFGHTIGRSIGLGLCPVPRRPAHRRVAGGRLVRGGDRHRARPGDAPRSGRRTTRRTPASGSVRSEPWDRRLASSSSAGGVMGIGLLYHLAEEGWTDTILIEKGALTSGSTWHAAGQCPSFIADHTMAKVHAYGNDLYARLESMTGVADGLARGRRDPLRDHRAGAGSLQAGRGRRRDDRLPDAGHQPRGDPAPQPVRHDRRACWPGPGRSTTATWTRPAPAMRWRPPPGDWAPPSSSTNRVTGDRAAAQRWIPGDDRAGRRHLRARGQCRRLLCRPRQRLAGRADHLRQHEAPVPGHRADPGVPRARRRAARDARSVCVRLLPAGAEVRSVRCL